MILSLLRDQLLYPTNQKSNYLLRDKYNFFDFKVTKRPATVRKTIPACFNKKCFTNEDSVCVYVH